jgi:ribonuclease E
MSEAFEPDPAELPVVTAEHVSEPSHAFFETGQAERVSERDAPTEPAQAASPPQMEAEQLAPPRHSEPLPAPAEREPLPVPEAREVLPAPSGVEAEDAAPEPLPEPVAAPEAVPEPAAAPPVLEDDRPKRSGWWNRKSFF